MRFLLALIFALFVNPLLAADNYTATQGSGTTFRAQDVGGGILSPYVVLGTTAGATIGGSAGTSNSFVLSVQGIASGTKLGISAASGDFASGSIAAGAVASGAFASGSISDGADVALGTRADAASCTGTQTVVSCLKQLHLDLVGSIPAGTNVIGYTTPDVCSQAVKTNLPINQNGTASVQLIALSGSTTIYVCSLFLMTNTTATTFAITTGTGTACVTGNAAVIGSTTANIANSMGLVAGAGLTFGNGLGTVAKGAASSELCLILGSNVYVAGNLTYVQQ